MLSLLVASAIQSALVIEHPHVLVFSKTTGFRHDSIPNAIEAIKKLGVEHGFIVDATEDAKAFTDANLKQYDLIAFASTTGTILDADQKKAMERFVEGGKGWIGIHSAADTEYDWPWYGELVGAWFKSHPPGGQHVKVVVENRGNPSTTGLPNLWVRPDEWYDWRANPRSKVQVLASLDESFYRPENPQDHPIMWCHWQGKGRSWYCEMGHTKESYTEKPYVDELYGGLMWAAQGSRKLDGAVEFSSKTNVNGSCFFHSEFKVDKGGSISVGFGGKNSINLNDSTGVAWDQLRGANCGGTNGQPPTVNAFAGAEYWNTVDAVLDAQHHCFSEVRINDIVVQKNVDLIGPIGSIVLGPGQATFRNTWAKKL